MATLTAKERNKMPSGRFGLPKKRKYPLKDAEHARNALARAAEFASPAEQAEIKRNVHKFFPGIKIGGK